MIEIFDQIEQGSPEWHAIRRGIPTASMFATVMRTKGRGEGGDSKTRLKYARQIAGEILSGEPMESYENADTLRGKAQEAQARNLYQFISSTQVKQIGFARDLEKGAGCSPDGLVGEDGTLELKSARPDILIETILNGEFPTEHRPQCQGALWVLEREWIDIQVSWPTMPVPFIKRAYRNEDFIKGLAEAVTRFNEEVQDIVERVRRYGDPNAVRDALERSLA